MAKRRGLIVDSGGEIIDLATGVRRPLPEPMPVPIVPVPEGACGVIVPEYLGRFDFPYAKGVDVFRFAEPSVPAGFYQDDEP